MTEESNITTQSDLDFFYSKVDEALSSTQRYINEEISLFTVKLESLEQQLATLTVGLAEQAVFIESLIFLLEDDTQEKQKAFAGKVKELRKLMIETLEYATDVMENGDTEPEQPVENVAGKDSTSSSGE